MNETTKLVLKVAIVGAIIGSLIGAAIVYAILSQTVPAVNVGSAISSVNCVQVTANGQSTPPFNAIVNVPLRFGCPSGTTWNPALHSIGGPATPAFTAPVSTVFLVVSADTSSCSGGIVLTSGISVTIPTGDYDYCIAYQASSSSFNVSWT